MGKKKKKKKRIQEEKKKKPERYKPQQMASSKVSQSLWLGLSSKNSLHPKVFQIKVMQWPFPLWGMYFYPPLSLPLPRTSKAILGCEHLMDSQAQEVVSDCLGDGYSSSEVIQ